MTVQSFRNQFIIPVSDKHMSTENKFITNWVLSMFQKEDAATTYTAPSANPPSTDLVKQENDQYIVNHSQKDDSEEIFSSDSYDCTPVMCLQPAHGNRKW